MQDGLQIKKAGVIDIEHPYKGRIGDDEIVKKYQNVIIGLNGDYRLPMDLKAAVEQVGRDFLKYAEDNGINLVEYGFDINDDGKVGPQEAGSGCASLALDHGKQDVGSKRDQVVSRFRPGCVFEIVRSLNPNPRVKGENWRAAEQILGDTWPDQVKNPTNTEEADKAFLGRYKSGNDTLLR